MELGMFLKVGTNAVPTNNSIWQSGNRSLRTCSASFPSILPERADRNKQKSQSKVERQKRGGSYIFQCWRCFPATQPSCCPTPSDASSHHTQGHTVTKSIEVSWAVRKGWNDSDTSLSILFYLSVFEPHTSFWFWDRSAQISLLTVPQGRYGVPGIKPGSGACKAVPCLLYYPFSQVVFILLFKIR